MRDQAAVGAETADAETIGADAAERPELPPQPHYVPASIMRLWHKLARPSADQDRSAELAAEPRGRLDRLDLWVLAALIAGLLITRVYNLGQPPSMYFDEVYHARSATEFLQDWRYDIPHDIYEWTHPMLAKYAIAAGITLFDDDRVTATSSLAVPVAAAIVQERTVEEPGTTADSSAGIDYDTDYGDRALVATGTEVQVYNLSSGALAYTYAIPGAVALSAPDTEGLVYVGTTRGSIFVLNTTTLDALRAGQVTTIPPPVQLSVTTGMAIAHLFAGAAPYLLAADAAGDAVSIDLSAGDAIVGRSLIPGAADFLDPGAGILSSGADPEVLVAYRAGVGVLDVRRLTLTSTIPTASPATSLALNPDAVKPNTYRIYATAGDAVTLLSLDTSSSPAVLAAEAGQPLSVMPGSVTWVVFDEATKIVSVLGRTSDGAGWTVYAVEANGNAVFSDAPVPFAPVAIGLDNAVSVAGIDKVVAMPDADRETLLAFGPDGAMASVDVGGFAFSWRIVGVLFGVLLAVCLYLLARLLFRRRSVGVLVAFFCLVDGMAFAQSRIAMNDVYVGGFLLLAYLLFAALWLRVWQHRAFFWLGMPALGLVLGLALASKWVALYAIASIGVLILIRSALGRLLTILGLIAGTGILGWQAIAEMSYQPGSGNMPAAVLLLAAGAAVVGVGTAAVIGTHLEPDKVSLGAATAVISGTLFAGALWVSPGTLEGGAPNYTFFLLMLAITAIAAAAAAARPIAWTREELHFALVAPAFFGAGAPLLLAVTALPIGFPFVLMAVLKISLIGAGAGLGLGALAAGAFWIGGRAGFGPLAPQSAPGSPRALWGASGPAPSGWLRLGSGFGLPAAWMAFCLALLPFAVYIVLYIPWAMPTQPQTAATGALPAIVCWGRDPGGLCTDAWPAGHTGQTLPDLTVAMYNYHNDLRASHPASSPWWAWPLDLKPVWFASGANVPGVFSEIYDAGNPVLWWLAIGGIAFVSFQAWRRRNLGLGLIAAAFFWQWLSWARIDRVAFQYHFYTALPFFLLALAYFLAELWHGPSSRIWLAARVAGAAAALVPAALWLAAPELCGLARVDTSGYYGNLVCGGGSNLPITIFWLLFGGVLAYLSLSAHRPRRFVIGVCVAAGAAFLFLYPALSALWLPNSFTNLYALLSPTFAYGFQFSTNLQLSASVKLAGLGAVAATALAAGVALSAAQLVLGQRRAALLKSPESDEDEGGEKEIPESGPPNTPPADGDRAE